MEIKIGIKDTSRELALDLDTNSEEFETQLISAIKTQEIIDLAGKRQTHTLVSGAGIVYTEFSSEHQNRVGFALQIERPGCPMIDNSTTEQVQPTHIGTIPVYAKNVIHTSSNRD